MSDLFERIASNPVLSRYRVPVVYVLSGGASRGFCHLGMIEALEKRGVRPDLVVGASAGALFGALYASYGNVAGVYNRVDEVLASPEFRSFEQKYFDKPEAEGSRIGLERFVAGVAETLKTGIRLGTAMITSSMIAERDASALFSRIFRGIGFEALKIPFAAVAVDLAEGRPVILGLEETVAPAGAAGRAVAGSEALARAVQASSAIPLIFPSVEFGGAAFVDGGVMANLPVREAMSLLGREALVIGFDVSPPVGKPDRELSSLDLALRLLDLSIRSKQSADRELVDVLFDPVDRHYPWSSFSEYREFVDLGRNHMTEPRLSGLDSALVGKCREAIGREGNILRRLSASRRLRRAVASNQQASRN
jgi:NTE family protein